MAIASGVPTMPSLPTGMTIVTLIGDTLLHALMDIRTLIFGQNLTELRERAFAFLSSRELSAFSGDGGVGGVAAFCTHLLSMLTSTLHEFLDRLRLLGRKTRVFRRFRGCEFTNRLMQMPHHLHAATVTPTVLAPEPSGLRFAIGEEVGGAQDR